MNLCVNASRQRSPRRERKYLDLELPPSSLETSWGMPIHLLFFPSVRFLHELARFPVVGGTSIADLFATETDKSLDITLSIVKILADLTAEIQSLEAQFQNDQRQAHNTGFKSWLFEQPLLTKHQQAAGRPEANH